MQANELYRQQDVESVMVPDAVQLTGGASSILGVGASGNSGVIILTRGPDKGIHSITSGGLGGGVDVDLSVGISFGRMTGISENKKLGSLDGIGMGYGISGGLFGHISLLGSYSTSPQGNWIFSGLGIGVSPLPSPASGSVQTTWTKTIEGIKF